MTRPSVDSYLTDDLVACVKCGVTQPKAVLVGTGKTMFCKDDERCIKFRIDAAVEVERTRILLGMRIRLKIDEMLTSIASAKPSRRRKAKK